MNYREIIRATLKDAGGDVKAACDALCDGSYLQKCGYQEVDMPNVEAAYLKLKSLIKADKPGRPAIYNEPVREVRFRLPLSEYDRLGPEPNKKAAAIVRNKLSGKTG